MLSESERIYGATALMLSAATTDFEQSVHPWTHQSTRGQMTGNPEQHQLPILLKKQLFTFLGTNGSWNAACIKLAENQATRS